MKKVLCIILGLFFFLYLPALSKEEAPIRIGIAVNSAPFESISFDGKKKGFSVDLIIEIMRRLDLHFIFVPIQHNDLLPNLNQRKIDLILTLPYSVKNEINYAISEAHSYEAPVFLVPKESSYKGMTDFKNKRILVIANGNLLSYLEAFNLNVRITEANEVEKLIQLIKTREYEALFIGYEKANYYLHKYAINKDYRMIPTTLKYIGNHFATLPSKISFLHRIDSVLKKIKLDGTYEKILSKNFSYEKKQQNKKKISLLNIIIGLLILYYIYCLVLVFRRHYRDKNKLKFSKEYIHQIINDLPFMMRVQEVSDSSVTSVVKMFEKATEDVSQKSFFQFKDEGLLSIDSQKELEGLIHNVIDKRNRIHEIYPIILTNGEVLHRFLTMLTFEIHKKNYFFLACVDVSDLIEARQLAEQANQDKELFLENISHEIRTPLNAITGFCELYPQLRTEDEKKSYKQIICLNNQLLKKLIQDILDYSLIESGLKDGKSEHLDVVPFFHNLEKKYTSNVKNKVILEFFHPYESCFFSFNKLLFERIAENFILNALKYTIKGKIQVGYIYMETDFIFYVYDTGLGIPLERLNTIFNTFDKIDLFAQGTGLGLAICKAIVQRQEVGSSIGVASKEGEGSLFWISLRKKDCQAVLKSNFDLNQILSALEKKEGVWYTKDFRVRMQSHKFRKGERNE